MEELKEVLDNAVDSIMTLEDQVAVLQYHKDILLGELRNCKRIFDHEDMPGYSHYVSMALKMVNGEGVEHA